MYSLPPNPNRIICHELPPRCRRDAIAFCLWLAAGSAGAAPVVILDPGHGGYDPGATVGRVYEKHLNLDLANRVAAYLKRVGLRVQLTRQSDTFISLPGRTRIADRYSSAIFVRLHFNWTPDSSKRGIETYYCNGSRSLRTPDLV